MILKNNFKFKTLQFLYRSLPFDLAADWQVNKTASEIDISCIIPSRRAAQLKNIIEDLSLQDYPKEKYEVIIVQEDSKVIGFLRNEGLARSQGRLILFLDDDTRIFQKDFLTQASLLLHQHNADILQPHAHSLYGIVQTKQDYLDPFSFASRCCLYRRSLLERLGGFQADLNSYSDIELGIRAMMLKPVVFQTNELNYYHPPLFFESMQKPLAIGQSIFKLRRHYPFLLWLLIYLNALRFLPCRLWPSRANRSWFKISLGVLLYPFRRGEYYHT